MSTQALHSSAPSEAKTAAVRNILFVATLLLAWISASPFPSLSDPRLIELNDNSDLFNQLAYVVLAVAVVTYLVIHEPLRLRPLLRPAYVAMIAWLAISVVTSIEPALSAKRFAYTLLVIVLAGALPLLPAHLKRFAELSAAAVMTVLALCYAGVLLVPDLAIHQAYDTLEPLLAGDWRGTFAHKNIAGPMMVNFIFFGLFIARARSAALGWTIAAAAALFLWFAQAKASTGLLPLVLLLSWATARVRSRVVCALLVFIPTIALNLFTVGSLYSESIKAADTVILKDPTFTGRNDIWQFAIDNIHERPWLGHGFGAFWETPVTVFQPTTEGSLATTASHAHNAFLDLTLTIGIPGVLLAILWTLILPFLDWQRSRAAGADADLMLLFSRIWMFGIYTGSFESVLFERGSAPWFTMLMAMFGLRYLSVTRLQR